jgi:hypothetical protein
MNLMTNKAWLEYEKRGAKYPERDRPFFALRSKEELKQVLEQIAEIFLSSKTPLMWDSGICGYRPRGKSLTQWVATDGSEIKAPLLDLMLDYTEDIKTLHEWLYYGDIELIREYHIKAAVVNQEKYENAKFLGDL